ncbi:choice-of-anchor L domain-containing protein [Cellulomonas sp. NPDC057328]|uniref:choice-of-anchor L domain-containing protein n=1 Tax=Cellulomonas sp. NPDC057328 TaxID=3346101 RepID=UPI003643C4C3
MRATRRLPALVVLAALVLAGATAPAAADDVARERTPTAPAAAARALAAADASPRSLAEAMGVPADDVLDADLMGSDPAALAIASRAVNGFPSSGDTYLVLSTGSASSALLPNSSSSTSTVLGGTDNAQGNDLARLHLSLQPPPGAQCLAFDVAFYSEEFPEFVGAGVSDAFTAQIGSSELSIVDGQVVAENNFAFDERGAALSVDTAFGVTGSTGTTYDGGTARLRAVTPVFDPFQVDLYLSIQDLGDSVYDSAAFLDGFFWSRDSSCTAGSTKDTDGDGLLDEWETQGLTYVDEDGQHTVDLPAMGADPQVRDIFVEVDHMAADGPGDSHAPRPDAIDLVVDAFARQGIHLHVDYGRNAPLRWGTQATWGSLSRADVLPHRTYLGAKGFWTLGQYSWSEFNEIKAAHFDDERSAVFHYNVWAHQLDEGNRSSGMARIDGSDFIVSLGAFSTATQQDTMYQAGTFMHELGHNLGLRHGGHDETNRKPNYLSVMSYAFQFPGLPAANGARVVDYSTSELDPLYEGGLLDEPSGIGTSRWTFHRCGSTTWVSSGRQVDWNCDGDRSDVWVQADVNDDGRETLLEGHDDWSNLNLTGGGIGRPGAIIEEEEVQQLDAPEATPEDAVLVGPAFADLRLSGERVAVGATTRATATLPDLAVDPSTVQVTFSWGDGSASTAALAVGTTWRAAAEHAYTAPGAYEVTVTLSGAAGLSWTGPVLAEVTDAPAPPPGAALQTGADLTLTNTFALAGDEGGTSVVRGDLRCTSAASVAGDVLVTGDAYLTNTCRVLGTLTVAGDVRTDSTPKVDGDVLAGGSVVIGASTRVAGSVRASGAVTSPDGLTVEQLRARGVVSGDVEPGADVDVPVPAALPAFTFDASQWASTVVPWSAWVNRAASTNAAPSWGAGLTSSPGCTVAPWSSSINGPALTVEEDLVVDARRATSGCASVGVQSVELRLAGDLTVVADGFAAVGGLRATSADGEPHVLRVLVPAGSTGAEIRLPQGGTVDPTITVQLVTPGTVRVNGPIAFTGQVAAGSVAATGAVRLAGAVVGTPGLG